jgi:hypothetical protein
MTPDRSGLFLPKKRGSRGTGAPCKQDRGINAEYPSKHHRKLVWTKLANDYLTLTFYCSSLNNSAIIDNITVRRVYWFELKIDCVGRRMKGVIAW